MDQVSDRPAPLAGEQGGEGAREPDDAGRASLGIEPTGVEAVDRVVADVAAVAGAPLGDHVQVFERAHEQLRRALDAPADGVTDGVTDGERGA
jgi:hypothetical protein